eukprot:7063149-Alexandrium_andersonii.AAC.1
MCVDEDCRNYLRAAAPLIRAAIIFMGWPHSSRNLASSLVARCSAYDLSFRGPDHSFNEQRVNQ